MMKKSMIDHQSVAAAFLSVLMVVVSVIPGAGCGDGQADLTGFTIRERASSKLTSEEVVNGSRIMPNTQVSQPGTEPNAFATKDQNSRKDPVLSTESSGSAGPKSIGPVDTPASAGKRALAGDSREQTNGESEPSVEDAPKKPQGTKLPADLLEGSRTIPLNRQGSVLLDVEGKRVLLRARVCLTAGLLEMLLCPHQTKEHESILSTDAMAYTVHTGLLTLGCKEGQAARYDPDTNIYSPARGQVVDIFLHWVDVDGKLRRERAQNWVRRSRQRYYEAKFETLPAGLKLEPDGNLRYDDMNKVIFWYGPMDEKQRDECLTLSDDKQFQTAIHSFFKDSQEQPMTADWVFVGSGFYQDGDSAKQYLAEGGYMICVANFEMAMIDVATPSDSNGTESLSYEAATDRIPPRESEVLIELVPRPSEKSTTDKATDEKAAPAAEKAEPTATTSSSAAN